MRSLRRWLQQSWVGRWLLLPYRFWFGLSYYRVPLRNLFAWSFRSRELANFTYSLTRLNGEYLAHTISAVTGVSFTEAMGYLLEIENDAELKEHVRVAIRSSDYRHVSDEQVSFGRRIGWYAFARILKPRVIVETGVDKGHGAVMLCAALLRNAEDGHPGRYLGTDINPDAGFLLTQPYSQVGAILYGDSLESLATISSIDLFINDSDHSADYEAREYEAILPKLSYAGVILGDNSHVTDELAAFSVKHGRRFIFFREQPENHWYPGAGIGISYRSAAASDKNSELPQSQHQLQ